eukprot:1196280-Lingulodinium_polyedra.AAC.1
MKQHHNLEPQVFAVTPRRVTWALDKEQLCWITRTGYPLVPDFATILGACWGYVGTFWVYVGTV